MVKAIGKPSTGTRRAQFMSGMGNGALALLPQAAAPILDSAIASDRQDAAGNLAPRSLFGDPGAGRVQLNALKRPAGSMGFRLHVIELISANDIEQAFAGRKGPR